MAARALRERGTKAKSFGIFAEGATYTDIRGRDPFSDLWRELCGKLGAPALAVHVFGISKAQIVALKDDVGATKPAREPLDLLIRRMHDLHGFDVAVIAFDRIPLNQHVPHDCMRGEVNFVLDRLCARALLPPAFLEEAGQLLRRHRRPPQVLRGPGRPPRGCLDVIYMDPMFEALFAGDEATVLHALGHKHRPKDWPAFDEHARYPDRDVLGKAVALATQEVRGIVRGDIKSNKHGWALWILRHAEDGAGIFGHAIAERLRVILA